MPPGMPVVHAASPNPGNPRHPLDRPAPGWRSRAAPRPQDRTHAHQDDNRPSLPTSRDEDPQGSHAQPSTNRGHLSSPPHAHRAQPHSPAIVPGEQVSRIRLLLPALDEHLWFHNAEAATARRGTTSQMRAWDEEDASRVSRRGLRKSSAASVSCSVAETLANRRRRKRAGEWEGARLSFGVSVPAALNGYARSAQTQSCGRESCRSRGRMRQSSTTS